MRITTALSTELDIEDACREAAQTAEAGLDGADVDVCLVFVSGAYGPKAEAVPGLLTELLDPDRIVGCAAGGIIGGGNEIESGPALSLSLMHLGDSALSITHLIEQDLPDGDLGQDEWIRMLRLPPNEAKGIILLPDPFSFPTDRLLLGLDFAYPDTAKIGGLISSGTHPGGNMLFVDQTVYHEGAVVLSLTGNVTLETAVAQGCKPFGKIGQLTKVRDNQIERIDDSTAMEFLQEQLQGLPPEDLDLASSTPLFLGIAMDPFATSEPTPGDFLIRNMIGFDPQSGTLAIGGGLGTGRKVQFHLRDGTCSSQDLAAVLQRGVANEDLGGAGSCGALLFSCLGRGENLYGMPNHDSEMFRDIVGQLPLVGFFCNGEIGPVQGATHLHGYTSVFGILRETKP